MSAEVLKYTREQIETMEVAVADHAQPSAGSTGELATLAASP